MDASRENIELKGVISELRKQIKAYNLELPVGCEANTFNKMVDVGDEA